MCNVQFQRLLNHSGHFNTQLTKVSTVKSPTSNTFAQKCGRSIHIRKNSVIK